MTREHTEDKVDWKDGGERVWNNQESTNSRQRCKVIERCFSHSCETYGVSYLLCFSAKSKKYVTILRKGKRRQVVLKNFKKGQKCSEVLKFTRIQDN